MGFLDSTEFGNPDRLPNFQTWHELKSHLIKMLGQEPTVSHRFQMLKSLTKGPSENCQHYLIRSKYVAGMLRSISIEECTKILFLVGLQPDEKEFCDVQKDTNLEVLAELLNNRSDSPLESEVKAEYPIKVETEDVENLNTEDANTAPLDNYDEDSEDEPLSKHLGKPELSVRDKAVKLSRPPQGEAKTCKYCNILFCEFMQKDLADHQAKCPEKGKVKPKPCKFCGEKIRAKNMRIHMGSCDQNPRNEKIKCQLCKEDVLRRLFQVNKTFI